MERKGVFFRERDTDYLLHFLRLGTTRYSRIAWATRKAGSARSSWNSRTRDAPCKLHCCLSVFVLFCVFFFAQDDCFSCLLEGSLQSSTYSIQYTQVKDFFIIFFVEYSWRQRTIIDAKHHSWKIRDQSCGKLTMQRNSDLWAGVSSV